MNEQQIAQAALEFLDRTTLRGAEIEALMIVKNWLLPKAFPTAPEDPGSAQGAQGS